MHVDDGSGYDRDFCYDSRGRFKAIRDHSSGATFFTYGYDAASNVMSRANALNGVTESVPAGTAGYDVINRLLEKDLKLGGTTFAYEKPGYDAMSRITTVDREDLKRDTFGYNLNGEMTSALYQWQSNRNVSYTLDKAGNRTSVVDAGVTKYYTPDNINRYTTADSATQNSNNVGQGLAHQIGAFQNNNYEYIGDSYVVSISGGGSSYAVRYDALGRCVSRTINGVVTYYVFDGEKPILEYGSSGGLAAQNLYGKGIDEILARIDYTIGGAITYYQQDHEGSVTHLTNSSGTVVESYRYDAFGAVTIKNGSGQVISQTAYNNRFMFTGREFIKEFGIYEYRARTYHPGIGRFMSEDPKGFDAGDYNLFRYCHNDPLDLTDPMGLAAQPATSPIGAAEQEDKNVGHWRLHPNAFTSLVLDGPGVSSGGGGSSQGWSRKSPAGGYTTAQISYGTPIPNPDSQSYAHATWGGETDADRSMSRPQIKQRWGGDGAATTPNFDVQVKERSGKPLYEINITATRHMPNDVTKAEYARLWRIENKSVKCFADSVGSVGSRVNSLVSPIRSVEMGLQMVRSNLRDIVDAESLSCRFRADGAGGNKAP